MPKLDMRFVHHEHNLVVENNIMGIQLKIIKSRSSEDVGESTRLDVQMDFSEIHVWLILLDILKAPFHAVTFTATLLHLLIVFPVAYSLLEKLALLFWRY